MDEPWLDVCLIVKDEEAALPRCLAAIQRLHPILRTICVYDTGSTDASVSIARTAGCRVEQGYWDGDFARARNASLSMSDASWALIIDADDEVQADVSALTELLHGGTAVDVVDANCIHVDDSGTAQSTTRRFAAVRPDRVRFEGPVHEVPVRIGSATTRSCLARPSTLHMRHWGYASPITRRAKARRNLSGAERDVLLARQSGDASRIALSLFNRGRTRLLLDEAAEAAADLTDAFDQAYNLGIPLWTKIAPGAVDALMDSDRTDDAVALVERLGADPAGVQLARYLLGVMLLRMDRSSEALDVLSTVPTDTDAAVGVDVGALFASRLRAARACGRADAELAQLLVLVGREQRMELLPQLLDAWGDQPYELLASLLRESSPLQLNQLREALAGYGDYGRKTAR